MILRALDVYGQNGHVQTFRAWEGPLDVWTSISKSSMSKHFSRLMRLIHALDGGVYIYIYIIYLYVHRYMIVNKYMNTFLS